MNANSQNNSDTSRIIPAEEGLHALRNEVEEIFFAKSTSPEEFASEEEVCRCFSTTLLKYWHLCSIFTFLVEDDELREAAIHVDDHTDAKQARDAAARFADYVRRTEGEATVWMDAGEAATPNAGGNQAQSFVPDDVIASVGESNMRAGMGVPIRARGHLVGVLVVLTNSPADLREAQAGIRFIATPIVIAVSNARRAAFVRAQRADIDRLHDELRENILALEEANRELQRVARYRSLFLSRMSHELRTPLTSILGFSEILLEHEDLTSAQRRFCEKIQASGLQQQESLNALVDLSRLEAGHSELFLHEFSLREMLRESCAAVKQLARKAGVTIDREIDTELGTVVSDEGKLRQVIYNFLAFAIHRTPHGGRVTVSAGDAEGTPPHFFIEITDEGEPLSDPSHIFEPTDTGHAPGAMPNARGTDMNELGLVIAHRLVSVLGGDIELHAAESRGLRVRLTFTQLPQQSVVLE